MPLAAAAAIILQLMMGRSIATALPSGGGMKQEMLA